jgi:hypothetical protein
VKSAHVASQYFFSIQENLFRIEKIMRKLLIFKDEIYVFYKT